MTAPFRRRKLGEILLDRQSVSVDALERGLAGASGRLGETLLREGAVGTEEIAQALAIQAGLRYVDISTFEMSKPLFDVLPVSVAFQFGILPFDDAHGVLTVAVADPLDPHLATRLESITRKKVRFIVASATAIARALQRSEGESQVLKDISEDFKIALVKEDEKGGDEYISLGNLTDDSQGPVVRLTNSIISAAIHKRCSDIHIEAFDKETLVKYRIDGVLYPAVEMIDRRHHGALVSRLKVMAELDIAEKRMPQDGRFRLRFESRDVDFRVSILPSAHGEDVVIRILDKTSLTEGLKKLSLEGLGIDGDILKQFRKCIREPHGIVLITGPTGSGKTTTLYAALSELNSGEDKIITIEDPIEYLLPGIVQIAVNEKKGLTFAKGLRAILRHDPDKIMVGEIRDSETAHIATQSALTGHLVFSTVHANNVFEVVGRFSHMGVDPYHFVSALNCVMAQRLVRTICSNCKTEVTVDRGVLEASGLDPVGFSGRLWYEGRGCERCNHTGYRGRTAASEFLPLSSEIRRLIVARAPIDEIKAVAIGGGMKTLRQSAVDLAIAGATTLREINRVTFIE